MTELFRPVHPLHEVPPPVGVLLTQVNLAGVAAHLGLDVTLDPATERSGLAIPLQRRFGLTERANVGSWLIRHPFDGDRLEVVTRQQFARAWRVGDEPPAPDLPEAVRYELGVPAVGDLVVVAVVDLGDGHRRIRIHSEADPLLVLALLTKSQNTVLRGIEAAE